jgi:crotonobetainyl-CoA:carnitine CoA-transferase CaiB-like acyl-CoA transferase
LARALGHEEWIDDPRFASRDDRLGHDDALVALVGDVLQGADASTWDARGRVADVALVEVSEVPLEEWFEREGLLLPEDHEVFGPFWRAPVKVHLSATSPRIEPVAGLGEHTRAILAELGRDEDEIDRLVAAGVVVDGARSSSVNVGP